MTCHRSNIVRSRSGSPWSSCCPAGACRLDWCLGWTLIAASLFRFGIFWHPSQSLASPPPFLPLRSLWFITKWAQPFYWKLARFSDVQPSRWLDLDRKVCSFWPDCEHSWGAGTSNHCSQYRIGYHSFLDSVWLMKHLWPSFFACYDGHYSASSSGN